MAHCPFCHGDVSESLVLNGGTCPHCFGEIPGEETPTDPGEEVKAQMREEDLRNARRRTLMPLFVLAPVVLVGVLGAAYVALKPPPEVEEIVLGDDFLGEMTIALHAADPSELEDAEEAVKRSMDPSAEEPQVAKGSNPSRVKDIASSLGGSSSKILDGSSAVAGSKLSDGSASDGGSRRRVMGAGEDRAITGGGPIAMDGGSSGPSGSLSLDVGVQRTAPLLESQADITSAFRDVVKRRIPQVIQCYERRLKSQPDLGGTWRIALTIGLDGRFGGVSATGAEVSDPELEQCIAQRVSTWGIYGRLAEARPISFPLPLRPE